MQVLSKQKLSLTFVIPKSPVHARVVVSSPTAKRWGLKPLGTERVSEQVPEWVPEQVPARVLERVPEHSGAASGAGSTGQGLETPFSPI